MISLSRSFNRVLSLKEKEERGSATEEELQSIASLKKILSGGGGKGGRGEQEGDNGDDEEKVKISDVWNDDIEQAISKLFTGYKKELHHVWHTIIAAAGGERKTKKRTTNLYLTHTLWILCYP